MDRINVTALTPAACSVALWRRAGTWWATVVVKATFRLVPGDVAQMAAPLALVREDRHRGPSGSLEAASETDAPYLPGAGVVLTGHAYPPGGRAGTATTARLAIGRDRPLLDKSLHAYGDRRGTSVDPFDKMPLMYERAHGGPESLNNPVGVGGRGSPAFPNLYDPRDPLRTAGFGPISRSWPVRRRLLGTFDEAALHAPEPEIPEGIDWRYFHAAPPDQQIDVLRGDEWIVLDGMHPTLARVQTRLPSCVAKASWHQMKASGPEAGVAIELAADTLIIDADRLECSVLWRGRFALERIEMAPWLGVFAGVTLPGQSVAWPALKPASRLAVEEARTMAVGPPREAMTGPLPSGIRQSLASTSGVDLRAAMASILSFKPGDPRGSQDLAAPRSPLGASPRRAPDPLAGTASLDLQKILKDIIPFRGAAPPPLASVDPAATGTMDARLLRPSLPFAPPDPSKISFEAQIKSAPRSILARPPESLTGTAQTDYQDILRKILPFKTDPQPDFTPAADPRLEQEPDLRHMRGVGLPDAPHVPPSPPLYTPPPPAYGATSLPDAALPMAPLVVASTPPVQNRWSTDTSAAEQPAGKPVRAVPAVDVTAPATSASPIAAPGDPTPAVAGAPAALPPTLEAPASTAATDVPISLRDQILARLQARAPLQGLALGGADLQDFDFAGVSLAGLDLRRSNLRRANLSGVHAAEVQLEGADLTEVNFERADLSRANLTRAVVTKARFDGATLTGANIQRASGDEVSFRGAKLQSVDLRQARLPGANFDEAVLSSATITKTDLNGARFVRATLVGANLRESKLRDVDLSDANLEGADLRDTDLTRARFAGESRRTAKLTPAQLKALVENKP